MSIRVESDRTRIREQLSAWLATRLAGACEVAVSELELAHGGYSNETGYGNATWREADGTPRSQRFVIRLQPVGEPVFPDPDVLFQSRVMRAIGRVAGPPVPVIWFEEPDESVLGLPFFLMKFVAGRMLKLVPSYHQSGWVADLAPADRARLYDAALQSLVRLHQLDSRDGFDFLAEPGAGSALDRYLSAVERWALWAFDGRNFGPISEALGYVLAERPRDENVSVLWGDAHPVNMLFADDLSVAAVLDFEIAALGPAEIDLGWWLSVEELSTSAQRIEPLAGIPGRAATIERYEELSGRPARNMQYYQILGALRFSLSTVRIADRFVRSGKISSADEYGGVKLFKKILRGHLA